MNNHKYIIRFIFLKELLFIPNIFTGGKYMAKIIENFKGRRTIRLNTNDVINIVREYQNLSSCCTDYQEIRNKLDKFEMYLPEDIF